MLINKKDKIENNSCLYKEEVKSLVENSDILISLNSEGRRLVSHKLKVYVRDGDELHQVGLLQNFSVNASAKNLIVEMCAEFTHEKKSMTDKAKNSLRKFSTLLAEKGCRIDYRTDPLLGNTKNKPEVLQSNDTTVCSSGEEPPKVYLKTSYKKEQKTGFKKRYPELKIDPELKTKARRTKLKKSEEEIYSIFGKSSELALSALEQYVVDNTFLSKKKLTDFFKMTGNIRESLEKNSKKRK